MKKRAYISAMLKFGFKFGRLPFTKIPAPERHAIYGINCYQHAIGDNTAMILISGAAYEDESLSIQYVKMQPGTSHTHSKAFMQRVGYISPHVFCEIITKSCLEDGMHIIAKEDALSREWYKVAMYIRLRNGFAMDYHFARENDDGTWSHKRLFQKAETLKALPNAIGDYTLTRIFAAPKGIDATSTMHVASTATLSAGNHTASVRVMRQADDLPLGPNILVDKSTHSAQLKEDKRAIAMPAWHPDFDAAPGVPAL